MRKHLLILLFSTISIAANAQLINIENMRKGYKEGLQAGVSLSLDMKQNIKRIFQTTNVLDVQYKRKSNIFLFVNNISFLQIDADDALVNSGMQHLRYNYLLKKGKSPFTFELFGQHQYNSVKLVQTRLIAGVGPRIKLFCSDSTNFYMYVSSLIMYEYESLQDKANVILNSEEIESRMKADVVFSASFDVNKVFTISNVTYYQPQLSDMSDFRLSTDASFKFNVSDKLSFSIVFNMDYDSKPPVNEFDNSELIPKMFYNLSNRISYRF